MKVITYFKAYKRCISLKTAMIDARGALLGISVCNDFWALRWQRYDRLTRKLERKLEAMLGEGEKT